MKINRRNFNKLFLSTSALVVIPQNIFASPYNKPINWAGTSFLVPYSRIEVVMPIIKGAFEVPSEIIDGATFFNASLYNSLETKPIIKNLVLDGFDKDAKLALTLSFAAEFDFGGYDDIRQNPPIHYYLMKTFSHSILYNPSARTIVSSVPIRATIGGAIDIASKKEGWKSEVMTKSFYNDQNPEMSIVDQFRKMTSKLSLKNKWKGTAARVTSVTFSKKKKNLFNESLKLKLNDFKEFLGHSCTAAFSYKLNLPIIPYSVTQSAVATVSVFNDTTKMFQEIETALPNTDVRINLHHKGWKFKEKLLTHPIKQVTLYIGFRIQISDVLEEGGKIYSQHFSAQKRYIEEIEGSLRSDISEICFLTEALLERAFRSITDEQYRNKLAKGDFLRESEAVSFRFKLNISKKDPDYFNKTNKQSQKTIEILREL